MLKSHSFSPNHKIVTGAKHSFHMPGNAPKTGEMNMPTGGGSAEPAGGGAQGPQDAEFCNGGMKYADGGETDAPMGGGLKGKLHDYGTAIADTFHQMTSTPAKGGANSDPVASAREYAQRNTNAGIDKQIEDNGG